MRYRIYIVSVPLGTKPLDSFVKRTLTNPRATFYELGTSPISISKPNPMHAFSNDIKHGLIPRDNKTHPIV